MKQKIRLVIMVLIVTFSLVGVTSCDFVMELLGLSEDQALDLQVQSVEPLMSGTQVVGVRIILRNNGTTEANATYSIFLSQDSTISSVNDHKVYEASVDIAASGQKQIDLDGQNDIDAYMNANGVTLPSGDYFIGAFVDINDTVVEQNETNNEAVSIGKYPIDAVYSDGTVTFQVLNAGAFNGATVYCGAIEEGDPLGTGVFEATAGFIISGGSGSTVLTTATGFDWIASGGVRYDILAFIDVDGNADPADPQPGAGDVTVLTSIVVFVNGNVTGTFDLASTPFDITGTISGELSSMPAAANGTVVFFIVPAGTPLDENVLANIIASGDAVVDSAGNAFTVLYTGWPATASIYYGTVGNDYDMYSFIDMNGDLSGFGSIYDNPYDYTPAGMSSDTVVPRTIAYDGNSNMEIFSGSDYEVATGIVLELGITSTFNDHDVYFALVNDGGDPAVPNGVGQILWADPDEIAVLLNPSATYHWQGSAGQYDLHVYADMNDSGPAVPDSGDFVTLYDIDFAGGSSTIVVNQSDFTMVINSSAGIYTEDGAYPVVGNPTIAGEDTVVNIASGAVAAFDGTVVLQADFAQVNDVTGTYPWLLFYYSGAVAVDIGSVTNIVFSINVTAVPGGFGDMQFLIGDTTGFMNGAWISTASAYYVSSSGDWDTYSVPVLVDDFDIGNPIDPTQFSGIKIGWPSDAGLNYVAATIYFDQVHFE